MRLLPRAVTVAAIVFGLGLAVSASISQAPSADAAGGAVASRQALHDEMRTLWAADHIVWTRCFIVSAATLPTNLPDIGPTTDRLLFNQTEIGDTFGRYYGRAAGDQLTALLRTHILTAAQLIADAKAGDSAAVTADSQAWYANADAIATLLNQLNPKNWPFSTVQALLDRHLDLTLEEATARLAGHYSADISAYDQVHGEIIQLADVLSNGIIAQFPQKFTG
jgi:hypothetical protein